MYHIKAMYQFSLIVVAGVLLVSCNGTVAPKSREIVSDPSQMDKQNGENIKAALEFAMKNDGKLDDSIRFGRVDIVYKYYDNSEYQPAWSKEEKWQPIADSLYNCIANAELQGLFPNDYHFKNLHSLKNKLDGDSLQRMDAALWARADLMLTDGFMRLIKDLRQGRLQPDSISLNKDSALADNFFIANLKTLTEKKHFTPLLGSLAQKPY